VPDNDPHLLAAIEFQIGLGGGLKLRFGHQHAGRAAWRDRGLRTVLLISSSLESQHVRAKPGRMLFGKGIVIFWENTGIKSPGQVFNPTVVESMENARINTDPVVNGHDFLFPNNHSKDNSRYTISKVYCIASKPGAFPKKGKDRT
jgi:hypothetical protein